VTRHYVAARQYSVRGLWGKTPSLRNFAVSVVHFSPETDDSSEASQITPRLGRRQTIAARSGASSVAAPKDWTSVINFNSERRMKDRASREVHGASKEKSRCPKPAYKNILEGCVEMPRNRPDVVRLQSIRVLKIYLQ